MTIPMIAPAMAQPEDYATVRDWMVGWGREIAAVRVDAARTRFASDLIDFGTHGNVLRGRDAVATRQWCQVWPTIEDFHFELEWLDVFVSPDRAQAVALTPFSSTGIDGNGNRFHRPGRATVVLTRHTLGQSWLGRHTHLSLAPGVPERSYGWRPIVD